MKFVNFTTLYIILINILCILSTPINYESDNVLENKSITKRFVPELIFLGPYAVCAFYGFEKEDKWPCCNFNCDTISSSACRIACKNYKTEHKDCGRC